MQHNPKLIAVDLSSIVKLDTTIQTLPYVSITPMGSVEADVDAQDTVNYAIKVAKCVPLVIGQVAPLFIAEAYSWLKHVLGSKFLAILTDFEVVDVSELKYKAIHTYNRIYYAFDRVESDIHIWEENETEVLN